MPPTRSACSVCRHAAAAEINAALDLAYSYRWINERYGVSLGALSRHANHRPARDTDGQQPELERRLDQLENDVAMLRLVVGTDPRFLHGSREELAEVARWEDDGFPF